MSFPPLTLLKFAPAPFSSARTGMKFFSTKENSMLFDTSSGSKGMSLLMSSFKFRLTCDISKLTLVQEYSMKLSNLKDAKSWDDDYENDIIMIDD